MTNGTTNICMQIVQTIISFQKRMRIPFLPRPMASKARTTRRKKPTKALKETDGLARKTKDPNFLGFNAT